MSDNVTDPEHQLEPDRVVLGDGTVVRVTKVHYNSDDEIIAVEVDEALYTDSEVAYYLEPGDEVTESVMREALGDDWRPDADLVNEDDWRKDR